MPRKKKDSVDQPGLLEAQVSTAPCVPAIREKFKASLCPDMTSNRPLEEWGELLGDVPTAGAILDRFLRHAQTIAITGRSYRLKDHTTIAGKEDKNRKTKSKPNDPGYAGGFAEARPSTAEPAN